MTTIAFDGKVMAADTLAVDALGLKSECREKIRVGEVFLLGISGEIGLAQKWWDSILLEYQVDIPTFSMLMKHGYPAYEKDKNDLGLLLVNSSGEIFTHSSGVFLHENRKFFAIGSGRDYALAAMHCGKNASEAVAIASIYDNNTGSDAIQLGF